MHPISHNSLMMSWSEFLRTEIKEPESKNVLQWKRHEWDKRQRSLSGAVRQCGVTSLHLEPVRVGDLLNQNQLCQIRSALVPHFMFALQHYTAVKLIMCRLIVCHRPRRVGEMWTSLSFQVLYQSVAAVSICVCGHNSQSWGGNK